MFRYLDQVSGAGEEQVLGFPEGGHLVPGERGRYGRVGPGAQRVGAMVVLAPLF